MTFVPQKIPTASTPLRSAIRYGILGLVVLSILSAGLWSIAAGLAGLYGALIGAAFGGSFILFTVVVVVLTANVQPVTGGAVLLGSWLLKIVLAIVVLGLLKPLDFYSKPALALTVVLALVVVLSCETYAIVTQKVPYVDPVDPHSGKSTTGGYDD
ncbi:MAG: hypothetical protein ACRCSF_10350 [Mycobacteriaceae bacterium]